MANPVMSSGHSMSVTRFADRCEGQIERLDPLLDDPDFIGELFQEARILTDGKHLTKPAKQSGTHEART